MTRKNKKNKAAAAPSDEESILPSAVDANPPSAPSVEEDPLAEARRLLIEEMEQAEQNSSVLKKMTGRLRGTGMLNRNKVKTPSELAEEESRLDQRIEDTLIGETAATQDNLLLESETQAILDALDQADSIPPSTPEAAPTPPVLPEEVTTPPVEPAPRLEPGPAHGDPGYREIRNIALEGYQEPSTDAMAPRQSINQQVGEFAQRIQYQTLVRITIASLTAVVCLGVLMVAVLVFKVPLFGTPPVSTETPIATVAAPIPIQVRMTGGWVFTLSRGEVVNGKWTPKTAEWLDGTDICRWVSLPWTPQLEAVYRSLKPGDRIDLVMSNYDHWTFHVKSMEEKRTFELASMDKNYPSMLLILTNPDSDIRLVVLAAP
jgi:hypothetical protein